MTKTNYKNPSATAPPETSRRPEGEPSGLVRIATLGAIGHIPWAPGTVAALTAVAFVALFDLIPFQHWFRTPILCLAAGIAFAVGVPAGHKSEAFFHRRDPGQVVIDEFAGQLVAFVLEPTGTWKLLLSGFVAFRLFDIWKPFPARQAERLNGGWGIMVDDLVAGVYALVVVTLISRLLR